MRSMAFGTAAASGIVAAALMVAGAPAQAQDNWPSKTIRIVLSFGAPGGAPDVAARLLAPELTKAWGQPVIVDPKTGAGGIIGAETVAKSAPDGYTWLINSPAHVINVALYAGKLPYDPITDFTPVTLLGEVPNLLIIVPSVPARTAKEFIAHAKANPGKLNYGSAGTGSSQHLAGELFAKMAGVKMTHVPYKGGGAVVTDLLAGNLQLTFGSATSLPSIRAGKLVALGVSGLKRDPNMPDLPTISEAALPGYEASAWYAMYGPAKTPRPIVDKMYGEVARIFRMPDVREKLNFVTMQPIASTPDELAAYVKKELVKWSVIVKESGAKPEG